MSISRIALLLLAAGSAFAAADDPWAKLKDVKTGADLRVFKKGSMQPVLAQMGELTDENLVIVVKKEQIAIPRDQIDRVDARLAGRSRVTTTSTTKTTDPDYTPKPPGYGSATPQTTTSSSIGVGSRPDFETVYRRPSPTPKK